MYIYIHINIQKSDVVSSTINNWHIPMTKNIFQALYLMIPWDLTGN